MGKGINEKKYVLASVFNKRGIADFCCALASFGYQIIASEGTGQVLSEKGVDYILAEKESRNPNKLTDCIKTISFQLEGGILFDRNNPLQIEETNSLSIKPIDIVVCNFPPIKEVIKNPQQDFRIRNVDVGGPLMVRAAATNLKHVLIVVDPSDYPRVTESLSKGVVTNAFRQAFAIKAYSYCRAYDLDIINLLKKNQIFADESVTR